MTDHKANGLTQKELSLLILEGQDKINERIAKLAGGVALIKVGAATETEMKYKKLI